MTSSGSAQSVVALIMRAPSPVAGDRGSARRHQLAMTRVRTGSAPSYCEPLPARTAGGVCEAADLWPRAPAFGASRSPPDDCHSDHLERSAREAQGAPDRAVLL